MTILKKWLLTIGVWSSNTSIFLKALIIVVGIQVIWLIVWLLGGFASRGAMFEYFVCNYRLFWSFLFPFPAFVLWFWRSTLSSRLKTGLKRVIPNRVVPQLRLTRAWHVPISLAVVAFYGIHTNLAGLGYRLKPIVNSDPTAAAAATWVVDFGISIFFISMSVLYYMHLVRWFKSQIKGGIRVEPLHPDRCGGLHFVGSMFLKFVVFIVVFSLFTICFYFWQRSPAVIYMAIAGILYLVVIWYFVIDPLELVHNRMKDNRDDLLAQISSGFTKEIRKTKTNSERKSLALQRIQENHNIVRATYPLWPLTLPSGVILRVMTILPPVVGAIVSIIEL